MSSKYQPRQECRESAQYQEGCVAGNDKAPQACDLHKRGAPMVSGGGLEPAVAGCHEQPTCATGQVKVGEGLPVATRSHGLTRGDVPKWEQAFDLRAVASSPVRTESQAGLGDLASLHVTVKVLRPHVSGSR